MRHASRSVFVLRLFITAALFCASAFRLGALTTVTNLFSVNLAIPDGSLSGISDTRTVSLPDYTSITNLQVRLAISGGFNGDFYAYLTHGAGFSVLLNRPGRTVANPIGYGDSGLDVTFVNQPTNDVHRYGDFVMPSGPLTGAWSPDGRAVHPALVLDTDPRTALLNSFSGLDPNGDWTLFVADVDSGAQGTWLTWGIELTVVPEPGSLALFLTGGMAVILVSNARRRRSNLNENVIFLCKCPHYLNFSGREPARPFRTS